jgi:GxxExxY protein
MSRDLKALDTDSTNYHEHGPERARNRKNMSDLLYKEKAVQLAGLRMEIHRELGKGHDEVIYNDAFVVGLSRVNVPFGREKNYKVTYKGVVLPRRYYADFVVWDKILFEAKGVEKLTEAHVKQVLNRIGLQGIRVNSCN